MSQTKNNVCKVYGKNPNSISISKDGKVKNINPRNGSTGTISNGCPYNQLGFEDIPKIDL